LPTTAAALIWAPSVAVEAADAVVFIALEVKVDIMLKFELIIAPVIMLKFEAKVVVEAKAVLDVPGLKVVLKFEAVL
jgi:hypothetical protein